MRTKTRTGTRFKPMRVVWKDSAALRRKKPNKMDAERKEKIDEVVEDNMIFPFPMY